MFFKSTRYRSSGWARAWLVILTGLFAGFAAWYGVWLQNLNSAVNTNNAQTRLAIATLQAQVVEILSNNSTGGGVNVTTFETGSLAWYMFNNGYNVWDPVSSPAASVASASGMYAMQNVGLGNGAASFTQIQLGVPSAPLVTTGGITGNVLSLVVQFDAPQSQLLAASGNSELLPLTQLASQQLNLNPPCNTPNVCEQTTPNLGGHIEQPALVVQAHQLNSGSLFQWLAVQYDSASVFSGTISFTLKGPMNIVLG